MKYIFNNPLCKENTSHSSTMYMNLTLHLFKTQEYHHDRTKLHHCAVQRNQVTDKRKVTARGHQGWTLTEAGLGKSTWKHSSLRCSLTHELHWTFFSCFRGSTISSRPPLPEGCSHNKNSNARWSTTFVLTNFCNDICWEVPKLFSEVIWFCSLLWLHCCFCWEVAILSGWGSL